MFHVAVLAMNMAKNVKQSFVHDVAHFKKLSSSIFMLWNSTSDVIASHNTSEFYL
jgi:hypothetical protein